MLLLYAGVAKLFHAAEFRNALLFVPHLPLKLVPALTIAVPLLEAASGAGLLLGRGWGIGLAVGLFVATSWVAVLAHVRKQQVPCVCFSASANGALSLATIARNAIFALIALMPSVTSIRLVTEQPLILVFAAGAIFIYLCVELALQNESLTKDIERSL